MPIENIYSIDFFYDLLYIMFLVGLVVFVMLYFVDAGYGKMRSEKWGPAINNKVGWLLMECPVFFVMLYLYFKSFNFKLRHLSMNFNNIIKCSQLFYTCFSLPG